jgi:hypothetical protein
MMDFRNFNFKESFSSIEVAKLSPSDLAEYCRRRKEMLKAELRRLHSS